MSGANPRATHRTLVSWVAAVVPLAALLVLPPDTSAMSVTVGCPGAAGGPFDYTSLADAVAGLKAISYRDHVIVVSGTCREMVVLDGMENLRIEGTTGAVLQEPDGIAPTWPVLAAIGSARITISNLTFRGSERRRVLVDVYDSTVEIQDCVFQESHEGIFVQGRSNAFIRRSIIQDADWYGVRVDDNATVSIGDVDNDLVPTVIQRNGTGLIARNDSVANLQGATTFRENSTAISGQGGTVAFCCTAHERTVTDNGLGLDLLAGSKLIVEGPIRIEGNRYGGINATGASVRFWWGEYAIRNNGPVGIAVSHAGSVHLSGDGVVEDHTQAGISLVGSTVTLAGNVSVRNNGTPGGTMNGGIVAATGSVVSVNMGAGGSIAGNAGPGLLLTHNSTARLQRATVSGNQGDGVHVAALSSVLLFKTISIVGNAGFDLFCTPNSYGSGERSGVGRMLCPAFNQSPLPAGGPGER